MSELTTWLDSRGFREDSNIRSINFSEFYDMMLDVCATEREKSLDRRKMG